LSKNVAMFVDVANLYYSARGQDVDVDYVALLKHATKGRDLIRAYAYSGLDPENENQRKFIDFLGKNGYMVLTKDIRKFGDGRVKANLDIELVVDLFRLADRMDIAVIVSGDGDFAPAIKALQDKGVRCEVISFRPNTSSDLLAVADEFMDIMKIAGIGRSTKEAAAAKTAKGMSMPEMPAKEVVPEFGFRDASPAVANAALAALREGKDGRSGAASRSRGGRGRSTAKPAAEPAAAEAPEPAAAVANGEQGTEGRRRRRRRGGRGRGRNRAVEPETTTAAAEPGEIGWTELDDIAQVEGIALSDGDEDREYSFEEADEATLAELGLTAQQPAADAAESTEEKPKRTTRSRRTTAKSTDAAESTEEKPKRTTRSRRTTAKSTDAAESTEEKPKRTTRSRRTTAKSADAAGSESTEASGEGADAQGIWQRFRSARTPTR
jgi:uncharacterized LabA/DUF88 family protein